MNWWATSVEVCKVFWSTVVQICSYTNTVLQFLIKPTSDTMINISVVSTITVAVFFRVSILLLVIL